MDCLEWQLEWGQHEQFLRQKAASGQRVPALEAKPELFPDLIEVWSLWRQLHACRQTGWGVSPLPASEILVVLDLYRIHDKVLAFELILALDQVWLTWAAKEQERKMRDK